MTRVLLVPDLPLERWPSMDRYAHRLHDWLEGGDPGFEVRLAASIGDLTRDVSNGRSSWNPCCPRAPCSAISNTFVSAWSRISRTLRPSGW